MKLTNNKGINLLIFNRYLNYLLIYFTCKKCKGYKIFIQVFKYNFKIYYPSLFKISISILFWINSKKNKNEKPFLITKL